MQKDPVCQMDLDEDTAAANSTYQGKSYYFCATSCRDAFSKDPERYLPKRTDLLGRTLPSAQ